MENTYRLLAKKSEVDAQITRVASEIIAKHQPTADLLFVALLNGSMPFASKLMFEITRQSPDFYPNLHYMRVKTYEAQDAKEPNVEFENVLKHAKDRTVLVLDDVLDTGATCRFVKENLEQAGAHAIEFAFLAHKDMPNQGITPSYVGFEFGQNWLVGMGLDDSAVAPEAHRWAEDIWEIPQN